MSNSMVDVDMMDVDEQLQSSATLPIRPRSSTDTTSPLLNLPFELRQRIYTFCLISDMPISWPDASHSARGLGLGLLLSCKQVNLEASSLLYEQNTILFKHPSDCNMFQYVFNAQHAKGIKQMLLHIRDKDISALWTQYLSSTSTHRSLTCDFPNLEKLYIVVRSSIGLGTAGNNLFESYKRWTSSRGLNHLLESIQNQANAIQIKVLFVRFAARGEELALLEGIPQDFDKNPKGTPGPRLRTYWELKHGSQVALDGTVEHNPWFSGWLF